jgi:5-oxoprolinase (ATP-hydrolysing)
VQDALEDPNRTTPRRLAPYGLNAGGTGATGRNREIRINGEEEAIPATATQKLAAGDSLIIETPGGGGFASP